MFRFMLWLQKQFGYKNNLVTKTIWLQKHIEREVTKIKRESRPPRVTKTDGVWEDWLVTKAVTKSPASVSSITITRIGR